MARKSLRPELNKIRTWVRQGRTDAWIAHQLEVTVQQITAFKRENDLAPDEVEASGADSTEDIDLRAEDDALIAAELEKAEAQAEAETDVSDDDADEDANDHKPKRRRGRRGGRSRGGRKRADLEGTFDHGEEGYGLWLDPAVKDDPLYAEHWAGHRPVVVTVEADQIIIRRAGDDSAEDDD